MIRNCKYLEKGIGALQIIYGALLLFVLFYGFIILYDTPVSSLRYSWKDLSILKLIKKYHSEFILGALTMISGGLLLLNRKAGWMGTIITSFITAVLGIKSIFYLFYKTASPEFNRIGLLFYSSLISFLFFLIFCVLLSKPFKIKYQPTKKNWWVIIIVAGLLLVDKIIFDLLN